LREFARVEADTSGGGCAAFEKTHGIKIEFTMLPVDAWRAALKAELSAGSTGIDLAICRSRCPGGWPLTFSTTTKS